MRPINIINPLTHVLTEGLGEERKTWHKTLKVSRSVLYTWLKRGTVSKTKRFHVASILSVPVFKIPVEG
jgi:hypothetical protein